MEIINGFQCKTCTDVDYAKKHIDPAHPKDGPFGVNKTDASGRPADVHGPSVRLSGALAATGGVDKSSTTPGATSGTTTSTSAPTSYASGATVNLSI